jgi:hypothetical protein
MLGEKFYRKPVNFFGTIFRIEVDRRLQVFYNLPIERTIDSGIMYDGQMHSKK